MACWAPLPALCSSWETQPRSGNCSSKSSGIQEEQTPAALTQTLPRSTLDKGLINSGHTLLPQPGTRGVPSPDRCHRLHSSTLLSALLIFGASQHSGHIDFTTLAKAQRVGEGPAKVKTPGDSAAGVVPRLQVPLGNHSHPPFAASPQEN